jgi:hypothetical protein
MELVRCGWCNMQMLPKANDGHIKSRGRWWCCVAHLARFEDEEKTRAATSRGRLLTPNFMNLAHGG